MIQFKRNKIALSYLKKAFSIGAKQNYLHIPGWPHKIMNHLCSLALREEIETEYTKKLIRHHDIPPPSSPFSTPDNWPWKVQIKVFGQFNLRINNEEWISNRKSQQRPLEILKLLSFYPQGIHQDRLADFLWKDAEGDNAIQTLHTTLHRLRKLLNSHNVITLNSGVLRLNPSFVQIDLATFNQLIHKTDNITQAIINYENLHKLFKKGILQNEVESPWLIHLKKQIKNDFFNHANWLIDLLNNHGKIQKQIQVYRDLIHLAPSIEKNYQQLILLFLENGLNAEAMHTYQQCQTALKERFNISPSDTTKALLKKL